ncbi:unnamed protein product, partial [Mesorhabditis belari]|uniref:Ribosome biogenesis protein BOP1 homolog n=1 Tax=Mesorhabditis belari TaxID=2138241 RepID=A0AAF3F5D0_9BILA
MGEQKVEKAHGKKRKKNFGALDSNGTIENGTSDEQKTAISREKPRAFDEFDSSDEEDLRNTIGNIPVEWYDEEEHIGYDKEGNKIGKAKKSGEIDTFLEKMEDPDYWKKVFDRQTGQNVTLTQEQIDKIHAFAVGKYPSIGYNPYQPFVDFYTSEATIHPIDNRPASKSQFVPSKDEMKIVSRMVHAIKMGWLKPKEKKEKPKVYDLWGEEDDSNKTKSELARIRMHMPAPKLTLPTHAESYNPPEEYLLTEEEKKEWEEQDPEERRANFVPHKFEAMRKIPQYEKFVRERFERCLDLYLAPRQRRLKLNIENPEQLLPDLPNPNDLRPFPTTLAFYMRGHLGQVRSISVEPEKGELVASGGQDGTVRIWMLDSGRCIKTLDFGAPILSVAFCPTPNKTLLAVSYEGKRVALVNTETGDKLLNSQTTQFIDELPLNVEEGIPQVKWQKQKDRIVLEMNADVRKVVWHRRGDYLATVGILDHASSVIIHQLSKAKSQCPFSKKKGLVQSVAFHPTQPQFFVALSRHVRVYDLAKCQLIKKCLANSSHLSVMIADNQGDNLFVGGLDRRFSWIDLQLSNRPWKSLRHHGSAIRGIAYHKKYPLLATVSDDGSALVYYARIHTDSFRDNELVPVKRLRGHTKVGDLSMLDTAWHPTQPWLLTAGADGTIGLWSY